MSEVIRKYLRRWVDTWDRFWFTPSQAHALSLMRIALGLLLVYTHVVWTFELDLFFANSGFFSLEYRQAFADGSPFMWSHFDWSESAGWRWGSHLLAILILIAYTVGWQTRITAILSFLIVVSYAHRAGGALFGLDQINGFLALYLGIGPCGQHYSLDAKLRTKRQQPEPPLASTTATISMRLIQCHLCIVYLFAGLGKLQGSTWWDGTAIWGALASYEYQTLDMTWLVYLPWLVNIITLVSVFWELSYAFMIWRPLTRPLYLLLAVFVHLGIGLAMGMMTFGFVMLIANCAFVDPKLVQSLTNRFVARAGQ